MTLQKFAAPLGGCRGGMTSQVADFKDSRHYRTCSLIQEIGRPRTLRNSGLVRVLSVRYLALGNRLPILVDATSSEELSFCLFLLTATTCNKQRNGSWIKDSTNETGSHTGRFIHCRGRCGEFQSTCCSALQVRERYARTEFKKKLRTLRMCCA